MKKIPLRGRLGQGKFALVDDEDFWYLSQFRWYARQSKNNWYAERQEYLGNRKVKSHKMHREILRCLGDRRPDQHIKRVRNSGNESIGLLAHDNRVIGVRVGEKNKVSRHRRYLVLCRVDVLKIYVKKVLELLQT